MAKAVIDGAEASGRLEPGGTVVEFTGGTTGVSLAFVCAARGYPIELVTSDAFSEEKRQMMMAFGAKVIDVPSDKGKITKDLIQSMMRVAKEIASRPGHWQCDQLNNRDAITGYYPIGEELLRQTGGRVDAFVHSVGSAHSLHGVAKALRAYNDRIRIVAVEPAESAVLSGGAPGSHKIEGIGIGFIPPLWQPALVDEIDRVSTEESMEMARRLTREEGIFAGTSSGLNVVAALRVAKRLGPDATVATLVVDSGLRYLSTDLYRTV